MSDTPLQDFECEAVTQGQPTEEDESIPVVPDNGEIVVFLDLGKANGEGWLKDTEFDNEMEQAELKAMHDDDKKAIDTSNILSDDKEVGMREATQDKLYIEGDDENNFNPETTGRSAM